MIAKPPGVQLTDASVVSLLDRVARHADRSEWSDGERLARIVWSVLTEPGDGIAGTLISALGARVALELVWVDGAPALDETQLADEGHRVARRVLAQMGIADAELTESAVVAGFARWAPRMSPGWIDPVLRMAAVSQASVVTPDDDEWPERLGDLGAHAPHLLWCLGDPSLLSPRRSVAVVGSRNSTAYGAHATAELVTGLAERRYAVVSGAAYGIDGAAHRAALAAGGTTIAVLAGGVDRFYPAGHSELIARIAIDGLVISEAPFGFPPTGWRFLARNRLIAALSDAVVVVEAGRRSGSLNTANHASTIGRPLGAVPGPITNPESAGCHQLLRRGAQCLTSVEDIVDLAGGAPSEAQRESDALDPRAGRVLSALSIRTPRGAAAIAARAGLTTIDAIAALGLLAAGGRARQLDDGWVSVRAPRPPREDA